MFKVILQTMNREELESNTVSFESDTFRESFVFASMKAEELQLKASPNSSWQSCMEEENDKYMMITKDDIQVNFIHSDFDRYTGKRINGDE